MAYRERQDLRNTWAMPLVSLLFVGLTGVFLYGLVQQVALDKRFGNQPMSDAALIALSAGMLVFSIAMIYLFWISRQELELDDQGIRIRFAPWTGERRIPWTQLKSWRMGQYHPLWDFGGLGLHHTRKGAAYAIKGRQGMALELTDAHKGGKRFLIGTQDPRGLREAMEQMAPHGTFRTEPS